MEGELGIARGETGEARKIGRVKCNGMWQISRTASRKESWTWAGHCEHLVPEEKKLHWTALKKYYPLLLTSVNSSLQAALGHFERRQCWQKDIVQRDCDCQAEKVPLQIKSVSLACNVTPSRRELARNANGAVIIFPFCTLDQHLTKIVWPTTSSQEFKMASGQHHLLLPRMEL